jgi:hypothetical protein
MFGSPFGPVFRHPDASLPSFSRRRGFSRPTPERVFDVNHQSGSGFSGTSSSARQPRPIEPGFPVIPRFRRQMPERRVVVGWADWINRRGRPQTGRVGQPLRLQPPGRGSRAGERRWDHGAARRDPGGDDDRVMASIWTLRNPHDAQSSRPRPCAFGEQRRDKPPRSFVNAVTTPAKSP